MGSEFRRVLEQKRATLTAELASLKAELAELNSRIQVREGQLRNVSELLALEDGSPRTQADDAAPAGGVAGRSAPFLAATAELLGQVGRPLHYRDIAATLARQQVYVPGRDPAANLLAHMGRDARFRRFERGTYGLQSWPRKVTGRARASVDGARNQGEERTGG